jgi:GTP-binding protein
MRPHEEPPLVALSGRSNVGKSSLINRLLGQKVARTSQTPGCTTQTRLYPAAEGWIWADLPGYGYAVASQHARREWQAAVRTFLCQERPLVCVIIDGRLPPQPLDEQWVSWLTAQDLSFVILANKVDALSQRTYAQQQRRLPAAYHGALYWGWVSARTGDGIAPFLAWLRSYLGSQVATCRGV